MITGPETIWSDPSLGYSPIDTSTFNRYGGTSSTTTTITNKIQVYKDNTLKQMTNNPQIMYGSTLKNIKEIWVGNNKVFGTTTTTTTSGGVPVHYMYYYNGSWKGVQSMDSISVVKSYTQYSGDMQYGVYVGTGVAPTIYFNGTVISGIDLTHYGAAYQYKYNNYTVAIYNGSANTLNTTLTTIYGYMPNPKVSIAPYTVAFFNILNCQDSSNSGSDSGSELSNCYLTVDIPDKTTDVVVTLDFTGANNYQAT